MKQSKIKQLNEKYEKFIYHNFVKVKKKIPEVYNDMLDLLDYVTEPKNKMEVNKNGSNNN